MHSFSFSSIWSY